MLKGFFACFRLVILILGDRQQVALENLALRQQVAVLNRNIRRWCRYPHSLLRQSAFLITLFFLTESFALAQIDRLALGTRFNASGSQLTFRVFSSPATRIELYLY